MVICCLINLIFQKEMGRLGYKTKMKWSKENKSQFVFIIKILLKITMILTVKVCNFHLSEKFLSNVKGIKYLMLWGFMMFPFTFHL